ncbi:MAG: hypothetical protein KGZ97_05055, partial [Bacteroidetes bacterium]|nr:hypothetical protein [Bacteroidota bacterium]
MKTTTLFAIKKHYLMMTIFALSSFILSKTAFTQEHKTELILQEISHQADSKNVSSSGDKIKIATEVIEASHSLKAMETTSPDISMDKASRNHITKTIGENISDFISENRPEDKLHPEYGKAKLDESPESEEIMGMRTANSRTFKNPDGTFSTQYSYGTLHYEKDGYLVSIDNLVKPIKGKSNLYGMETTKLPIYVNATTGLTQMQLSHSGETILFGEKAKMSIVDSDGNIISEKTAGSNNRYSFSDNTVVINNLWENIDRIQKIDYWQVKTDYIINEKPNIANKGGEINFTEFVELPKGWKILKGDGFETNFGWQGSLIITDEKGAYMGAFELPVFFEGKMTSFSSLDIACGDYFSVDIDNSIADKKEKSFIEGSYRYEIEGNILKLTTVVPLEWLMAENRVFPVTIDPTVTNTYSAGNIGSCLNPEVNEVTKYITATAGAVVTQTASQWRYTAQNGQWRSEVYTRIRGNNAVYEWFRCNLDSGGNCDITLAAIYNDIANGVYIDGIVPITLGIMRTWGSVVPGCNTHYSFINNNTWVTTVTYANVPTPTVTCSATFYDTGGAGGNYANNETYAVTYQSTDGRNIKAAFVSFNVHTTDYLRIYDGPDFNSPLVGQYTGATSPGTLVSSGNTLTFLFYSDAATVAAGWQANISCAPTGATLYSYQNGNWESASTWTTDPSGTIFSNPGSLLPGANDKAVILNGRTVTVTAGSKTVEIVEIRNGGILDLVATTGNTFNNLNGQGILKLSSGTLPAGLMSSFVAPTGGTIEFYGNPADFTFNRNTFNNLIINFSNTARVASVGGNFIVNGNLTVKSGHFRIGNDATMRYVYFYDDVIVEGNGNISVRNANQYHHVFLHGNLTVQSGGAVRLHNLAEPSYDGIPATGFALFYCTSPAQNQTISLNGSFEPFWFIVDKGSNKTYTVDMTASGDFFRPFGYTYGDPGYVNYGNIRLYNGTLRLGSNIIVPQICHREGWAIGTNAQLIVDGAQLTITNTATHERADGFYLFGKISINNGSFIDNSHIGLVLRVAAEFEINGGTFTTDIIRPSINPGTHRGTYIQTGGTVNIQREITTVRANEFRMYGSLTLPFADNVMNMSGGTINILGNPTGTGAGDQVGAEFSIILCANLSNINISGGTINLTVPSARNAKINTIAPLWNLNTISSSSTYSAILSSFPGHGGAGIDAQPIRPLTLNGNFSISSPAKFDAANQNVTIKGNATIAAGATYIPGTNTTIFNGSAGQLFTNAGTITGPGLYNMSISNSAIVSITNNLAIRNDLSIATATILQDMGLTINVAGNISISGAHQSQGLGAIILSGGGNQIISGDGNGVFGNLRLNKATGTTSTTANIALTGNLRLANTAAKLTIGANRLSLSANSRIYHDLTSSSSVYTDFSATRMIETNGLQSDAGVVVTFASTDLRLFPIGSAGKYTPARLQFANAPTVWGSVRITPANSRHPLATSNNVLNYYWKISSSGFSGLPANSMRLRLYYSQTDVNGTEGNYVPGVYAPTSWTTYASEKVSEIINEILFDTHPTPQGDFTAGEPGAFGAITAFYSRNGGGDYDVAATWSPNSSGDPIATGAPTASNPVIIQNGHIVTVSANDRRAGTLTIENGGTLDLGVFTGHNFGSLHSGAVTGNGLLRISSSTATTSFPLADWGEFLAEGGGTVEYYTTGAQNFSISPVATSDPNYLHNFIIANSSILNEPFTNTTFPPIGWTIIDAGTGTGVWYHSTDLGNPGGAAVINDQAAGQVNDDYLITPRLIPLTGQSTFSFQRRRRTGPPGGANSSFMVRVSTTGTNIGDFVTVLGSTPADQNWTTTNVNLAAYIGQPIYVAIVCVSQFGMRVDNVTGLYLFVAPEPTEAGSFVEYNNLIVNPGVGRTITLPGSNLRVHNDLIIRGSGISTINNLAPTSIQIKKDLLVESGTFQYPNDRPHIVTVNGNINISSGATYTVASGTEVVNRLNVNGNLINNGTFNLFASAARYANVYFTPIIEQTLSGTGATTRFNRIFVDKGSGQSSRLNINSSNFVINTAIQQALTITNGTVRFNGPSASISGAHIFNIPETACLSVAGGTITIGGDDNASDITLAGKIEVSGGALNVGGAAATANNNDIEVAGGGRPEIVVSDGTLYVRGQIRRSATSTSGALVYNQSGGTINILGRSRILARAFFEVTNEGSSFTMSGGTLLLNRSETVGVKTFGDLYLNPSSYNVTGGTIQLGGTNALNGDIFELYLGCPVWNLTVDGNTRVKHARLITFPATILGNLQIGSSTAAQASTFNTNGLNVTIGGSLISHTTATSANIYQYVNATQTTIFNGVAASQAIQNSGTNPIRFGTITINNNQTNGRVDVTGTSNIEVYGNLNITNGELSQVGRLINLYGNVYNYAVHSSNGSAGALVFSSTTGQSIFGSNNAVFGYLAYLNTASKTVTSNNSFYITSGLDFGTTNNYLAMQSHGLTLGPNITSILNSSSSSFITTNGVISDLGITRQWSGTGLFMYPIGVAGKYTPVTMNVTNTGGSAGSITIKPINRFHPATANAQGDELQYYWTVSSSGFGATPTVTHTYTYLDGDVQGDEASYVGGRYNDMAWTTVGAINTVANTITLSDVNYINGEYTAGLAANFVSKPPLYSLISGNWNNTTNVWSTDGSTACGCAPNGNPVFIRNGHTITSTANNAFAYSVDIASGAILDLGQTIEHNLGHVTGAGTLKITSTAAGSFIFPGGNYEVFMNTDGSTVEYVGTGTLPSNITTYQNVTFSGAASFKYIPAVDLLVQGNLSISQGILDNRNYNRNITIYKNWLNNVSGGFLPGTGTVSFEGGLAQTLQNTAASETFYNLSINKTANHVTLNSNVVVSRTMTLTRGNFITQSNNLSLSWTSLLAVSGGSSASFVDGNLRKLISNGSSFIFPVGNGTRYGAARVFGTATTGNQYWTVRYYNEAPADRSNLVNPLQTVSDNEYWTIQCAAIGTANIRIRWDALSSPMPVPNNALYRQKLRVAQYVPGWTSVGQLIFDFGATNGTIQTSTPVSFTAATNNIFTVGVVETATAKIIGTVGGLTEFCDDGTTLAVIVELTGDSPWSFTYNINGGNATTVTSVGASPYNLIFNYADLFAISGVGNY